MGKFQEALLIVVTQAVGAATCIICSYCVRGKESSGESHITVKNSDLEEINISFVLMALSNHNGTKKYNHTV